MQIHICQDIIIIWHANTYLSRYKSGVGVNSQGMREDAELCFCATLNWFCLPSSYLLPHFVLLEDIWYYGQFAYPPPPLPRNFGFFWVGAILVDRPTQLICLWTNTKDIAGQSASAIYAIKH